MHAGRRSLASELSGRTSLPDLEFSKDIGKDQHEYLGRTGAHWDIREKIKVQSAREHCDCEVMTENIGVEVNEEHPLRAPDYGEPFRTQCLRIDFTPIPGLDDDPDRLEKVTTFWDYIRSSRQFKRLMVLPDPIDQVPSAESTSGSPMTVPEPEVAGGTEWLQDPATSFKLQSMANLPKPKYCPYEVVTEDYVIGDENAKFGEKIDKLSPLTKPSCSDIKSCYCKKNTDAYKLCQVMEDFDRKHPKSMEPPGHPPPLSYAILQRVHSSVALPSEKPRKKIGCDCPKLEFKKTCHCCEDGSLADLRSVK